MTEAEKLTQYKQSERYRAYQAGLADWRERQEKMRQAETADVTEAERLKEYKQTAEYQARQEAYEAYRQGEWTEAIFTPRPMPPPTPSVAAGTPKPSDVLTPVSMFRALNIDVESWKLYHLWQGDTNDCGPANIAMALNAFSGQPGLFTRETISEEMYRSWQRVPQELYVPTNWKSVFDKNSWENILETVGGATPPWSVVAAFNQRAASRGIDWRASLQSNGAKEDLLEQLRQGRPVTVLLVRQDGTAHYETVIGYDPEKDAIAALDPLNNPLIDQEVIQPQEWEKFNGDWSGKSLQGLGIQNDMIIYTPIPPTPSVPAAAPAPDAPTPAPSTPPPPQKSE